uniref:Odorant receptor n=1 Tax=Microplitis mediator TaxID=375433 RepID=M1S0B2_9HYME|nr:olfactory receptor 2 [Microplitis mediator]
MHHKLINILSKILRYNGIWPVESTTAISFKLLNLILRFFNFCIFVFLTSIIMADAIANHSDLSLITDNLCFLIGCFETMSKAFKFYTEYNNIIKLINDIYEPIDKLKTINNVEIMTRVNKLSRFECRQFYILCGVVALLISARVFGADRANREFPVRAIFPFDKSKSPNYQLIFILISYGVAFIDVSLFTLDLMIVVIMRYLTLQLEILISNYKHCRVGLIRNIARNIPSNGSETVESFYEIATVTDNDDDDNGDDGIKNFVIFEIHRKDINNINTFDWRLKQCIKHHQKIVQMMVVLNDCFSFCVIVQIMTSTILICLNGFQILLGNDDRHLLVRRIIAINAVLLQLFFWCWYGNKMSTVADSLTYNQWMCGWESEFKRGVSNSVTTSMILSLRSLELRAIGLVPLSLQTFVSAIKKSYSVLILLLTVVED